tara:strand:- start:9091 stop:9867 length:777 start_codon:yes stop_codon:yes gene_type:complete
MDTVKSSLNKSMASAKNLGETFSEKTSGLASRAKSFTDSTKESLKHLTDTPISSFIKNEGSTSSPFSFKSFLFWGLIILILAFLGFNIFSYLSKGTDLLTGILSPITSALGMLTGETTKTTISNASTGSKKIVDTTSNLSQDIIGTVGKGTSKGIDFLSNASTSGITALEKKLQKNKTNVIDAENNNKLIDGEKKQKYKDLDDSEPEPVRTSSQQHGYCYIGKINDVRTCAKVSSKNKCMSGDIYPNMDLCVNPNLRA